MINTNQFIEMMGADRTYGLMPPEISAQDVVNILQEVLLKNAHSPMNINENQNNSFVLHELLSRYSHKYRKEVLNVRKKNYNPNEGYDNI